MIYIWIFTVVLCSVIIASYQCGGLTRKNMNRLLPVGGMIALIDICSSMLLIAKNTTGLSVSALLWIFALNFFLLGINRFCSCSDFIWQHAWNLFAKMWYILTPTIVFLLMEWIGNADQFSMMDIKYRLAGVVILALLFGIMNCFCFSRKLAVGIFYAVAIVFSVANYYVTLIRGGNSILPSEIFAIRTVMNISSGYTLEFSEKIVLPFFVAVMCAVIGICTARYFDCRVNWKKHVLIGVITVLLAFGAYRKIDLLNSYYHVNLDYWQLQYSYYTYGIPVTFLALCQNNRVNEPENYSVENVDKIYNIYRNRENSEGERCEKKPTVIAIMNETWSDLSVIHEFESSPDYMAFWHGFDEPIMKGNLVVSVYGGGTCNSEFEFLTGASMGNLPQGVYPYQQYSLKDISSLPREFKTLGYDTVAIHPGNPVSWNRKEALIDLGFDQFLSEDDFENPERLRYYVSDRACYEKIIDEFETKKKEKFIFAVTIQNHWPYNEITFPENKMVQLETDLDMYSDVKEYLALLKNADNALADLFAYFEKVEEPVIICVFGDHQPFLVDQFYEKLYGHSMNELSLEEQERKYMTPYLIWANYDTGTELSRKTTSTNFLGAQLLKIAGALDNPFYKYLYSMQQEITEMNVDCYREKDGTLRAIKDGASDWLKNYQTVQYYELFDKEK